MLAQTVRSNLRDIDNLKMRSKATAFGKLFQIASVVEDEEFDTEQVIFEDEVFDIVEDESSEDGSFEYHVSEDYVEFDVEDEINEEDYVIVDNPDQVVVQFPIISDIQLEQKLPFFKSISLKLANL